MSPPSSLVHGIVKIIKVCAEKQVLGVTAASIIAFVKHVSLLWDIAVVDRPRKPVTKPMIVLDSLGSVSSPIDTPSPRPTFVWFSNLNFLPESFNGWLSSICSRLQLCFGKCRHAWIVTNGDSMSTLHLV